MTDSIEIRPYIALIFWFFLLLRTVTSVLHVASAMCCHNNITDGGDLDDDDRIIHSCAQSKQYNVAACSHPRRHNRSTEKTTLLNYIQLWRPAEPADLHAADMTSPAATIALGLAVLLLVGRSAPVRAQFFNNLVFRYSTLGDLVHVLQTDATKLYRQTIKKTVDLVACPFGECCVPEFVTGDVQGEY